MFESLDPRDHVYYLCLSNGLGPSFQSDLIHFTCVPMQMGLGGYREGVRVLAEGGCVLGTPRFPTIGKKKNSLIQYLIWIVGH